jgi:hypothetical protein
MAPIPYDARSQERSLRSCIALGIGLACGFVSPSWSQSRPQPPTATEAFNLRQKCDQLAQKWVADIKSAAAAASPPSPASPPTTSVSAVSHYSFSSASCYVLLTTDLYIPNNHQNLITNSLVEGQGGNELANFSIKLWTDHPTAKWGEVTDPSYAGRPTEPEAFGQQAQQEWDAHGVKRYDWASKYIDLKMSEP